MARSLPVLFLPDCCWLFWIVIACSKLFGVVLGRFFFLQKMPNLVIWEQKVIIRCDFWSPLYVVIAVLQVLLLEIGLQLIYLQSLYQIQINSLGIPYVKYRALCSFWGHLYKNKVNFNLKSIIRLAKQKKLISWEKILPWSCILKSKKEECTVFSQRIRKKEPYMYLLGSTYLFI